MTDSVVPGGTRKTARNQRGRAPVTATSLALTITQPPDLRGGEGNRIRGSDEDAAGHLDSTGILADAGPSRSSGGADGKLGE